MVTCTYILRLESLVKKAESLVQSLQGATIQPSEDQYRSLEALGARLSKAAVDVPLVVDALKDRDTAAVEEGRKVISEVQSYTRDIINAGKLRNRSVFGRNIVLFFEGPKDSVIDSQPTKVRKQLTRERCQRICSLSPDGLLSWAAALPPTKWTANLMSKGTFDYVLKHIEPDDFQVWLSEIYNILDALAAEEPLQDLTTIGSFLKVRSPSLRGLVRKLINYQLTKMERKPQVIYRQGNESAFWWCPQ
jgi:hypothetical protein